MRLQEFDLSGIASSVVDELRSADPERTVDVHVEPGILVNADPTLMRSVLSNLIGNAWKFSSCTETPAITFARDEHDPAIMFVRDNGAGFDMQYVDRLFGVFRRLPNASDIPGTGVGLATVRRILHRHDGRIWAEAQPGKGATFYFTVGGPERPRAAGREQAIETPRKAHQFVRP